MFKKLFNKIGYWFIGNQDRYAHDEPVQINHTRSIGKAIGSSSRQLEGNSINFNVFPATGGKVVQFSTYDPVKDRHNTRLYIITDKEELGEELAQIITRETLSN
jgi:hypothetical protein